MEGKRRKRSRRPWVKTMAAASAATVDLIYRGTPNRTLLLPADQPDPTAWPDRGVHAAWLGHSTVLLKIDGFTIITDPVLFERAGVHLGLMTLGIRRIVAPPLAIEQIRPVDLVLLSHAHMDHFDKRSLRQLAGPKTHVITASKTGDLLIPRRWASVHELGWGSRVRVGPVTVHGLEVNHWGARVRTDVWRGYNGYLIECGRYRVMFGGDTAETDRFAHLPVRQKVDLAIMPIGAYDPWVYRHCTPEQSWRMGEDARAELFMPVHHQTFVLGREPFHEPIDRLLDAAGAREKDVVLQRVGQEFSLR